MAAENPKSPALGGYRAVYILWLLFGIAWWNSYNEEAAERLRNLCNAVLSPIRSCRNDDDKPRREDSMIQEESPLLEIRPKYREMGTQTTFSYC